jgi:hypothetical protein
VSGVLQRGFTATEIRLLRLTLDKSAAVGEVQTGAIKLIESLRKRGVEAQDLEQLLALEPNRPQQLKPDYGLCTMPWGKHKGKIFADMSPSDLRSAVDWARSIPGGEVKFRRFIQSVNGFLNQGDS